MIMLALLIASIAAIGPYVAAVFGVVVLFFAGLWLLEAGYKLGVAANKAIQESKAYKAWRTALEANRVVIWWNSLHIAAKVCIVAAIPWILVFTPVVFVLLLMASPIIIPVLFIYWACTFNRRKYA
jgi:hypothetical protein